MSRISMSIVCAAAAIALAASSALAAVTINLKSRANTDTAGASAAITGSCGILKDYGDAPSSGRGARTARVKEGWHPDSYATTNDPNKHGKKYGNHITVDLFNASDYQMTCHLYKSGALWCDNGKGANPTHKCDAR